MTLPWLIVLVIYGLINSFSDIPVLLWFLLLPFIFQDIYDVSRDKR